MHRRSFVLASCFLLAGISIVQAQLKSGPTVDSEVKGFKVRAMTGEFADKEVDFQTERKDKTTIYLFVAADKFDRPMARYMKTLDQALVKGEEGSQGVDVVAVWLTEDVEAAKDRLPKINGSLKFERTALTIFSGAVQGPDTWGVDTEAHLTTVIVKGNKVLSSFGYRSTNETDVREVVAALKPKK